MMQDRSKLTVAGIVLAVVLFVSLNIFAAGTFTRARLDLTEDKLFTLSESTRRVLAELREPITLRLYVSKQLSDAQPGFSPYAQRVRELLERYAALASGKIKLEILNPEPFSDQEDRAVAFGLQGVPVGNGGELAYFGLAATNTTDDEEVLPFFDPQREAFLEYDLTKLIYALANPEKTVIGVLSTLPLQGDFRRRMDPWIVADQMKQFFDVRFLEGGQGRIDPDLDLLMIVHPKGLSEATLFAIDQYVLGGGKAMVFVDPHSEIAQAQGGATGQPVMDTASNFNRMLDAWNVYFNTELVVADASSARRVQANDGGRPVVTDYITWLGLGPNRFAANDAAFAQIERINLASAGSLKPKADSQMQLEALLTTTANTQLVPAEDLRRNPDPLTLLRRFESMGEPHVLGARLRGPIATAFPDGPPDGAEIEGEIRRSGRLDGQVVVFADSDLLADAFWVRVQNFFGEKLATPFANNGDLVLNLMEEMTGGVKLADLRGRGLSVRPFTQVEALRQAAEVTYRAQEQLLLDKLDETERKLADLQLTDDGAQGVLTLSAEQQQALENFRADRLAIRKELRQVQRALIEDIEALHDRLRLINIFAVPGGVAVLALVVALWRRARHRARAVNQ